MAAVPLVQACTNTQQLLNNALAQAAQEDAQDPLSCLSMERVQALSAGLQRALGRLREEGALFSSGDADLSAYSLERLSGTLSDVREASRKLAIVLSAGSGQFQNQAKQDAKTLQSLSPYVDPEVARDLCVPELTQLLQALDGANSQAAPCSCGYQRGQCPYGCVSAANGCTSAANIQIHPTEDFNKASTAAGTLTKLSKHFAELARHCEQIATRREDERDQQGAKKLEAEKLRDQAKELVPLIRSHVLRVGIGKGQHLNISSGCANVGTITQLFSYAAVEDAHRQLEDCRDQILQEITMRKLRAKMDESPGKRRKVSDGAAA